MQTRRVFLGLATALMLTGCGGSGSLIDNTQTLILSPAGGTLQTTNGVLKLQVPAGALSTTVAATAAPATGYPALTDLVAGTAFDLEPAGTNFSTNATLTIKYNEASIPGGNPESSLKVFKVNGSGWSEVTGSAVDTTGNSVSAPISGLGVYAIAVG